MAPRAARRDEGEPHDGDKQEENDVDRDLPRESGPHRGHDLVFEPVLTLEVLWLVVSGIVAAYPIDEPDDERDRHPGHDQDREDHCQVVPLVVTEATVV